MSKCVTTIREMRERELNNSQLKSKDYENSVNRYASWAYQQTFLVFILNFLGFTVTLKKYKEGNTHRFARIQSISYQIDNHTLSSILNNTNESENIIAENSNEVTNDNSNENLNELSHENMNELLNEISNDNGNEMEIENDSFVSESQNCQNNQCDLSQNENNGNDTNSENRMNKNVIYNTNLETDKNVIYNTKYSNEIIDHKMQTTQFVLFEDTEYFESICSSNQKKRNGSKNINDFAKMNSLFMMYFFNTFGIQFKIKGEGKTFPMITEMTFKDQTITNVMIQEFGRRHFSEMVRGYQLTPERILMKEKECDKECYSSICKFFMSIQESVYNNVKEYVLFIRFITNKFYNMYCNDDREKVMKMWEEGDESDVKYVKN